jgi:hypothetical protein
MVWEPLFWIAYDVYEGGSLLNGLMITNCDFGEFIYKFFMYCYNKGHMHIKKSSIWCKTLIFNQLKDYASSKLYNNDIFEFLS